VGTGGERVELKSVGWENGGLGEGWTRFAAAALLISYTPSPAHTTHPQEAL